MTLNSSRLRCETMRATTLDRRAFLRRLAGSAVGVMGFPLSCGSPTADQRNVLIVLSDQHRADVMGCAGDDQARTPHLDQLAAEGTRFSHVASSSPLCAPFRATLQSGLHAHVHRVDTNERRLGRRTLHWRFPRPTNPSFRQIPREKISHRYSISYASFCEP